MPAGRTECPNLLFRSPCAQDSLNGCRYAEAMHIARALLVLMFAAMTAATGFTAHADDAPVLAVLEYSGGLLPKRADIRAKTGTVKSPFAGMPRAVWTLREGDAVKQEYSPPARFIQFFQLSGNTPQLLCNIVVRYVRGQKGWRPTYLLLQQPPVTWNGEKFVPRTGMSTREPVQIVNPTEPTGDGFHHGLSFGLASGPAQITAWEVQ
jgi:hypothetical protein